MIYIDTRVLAAYYCPEIPSDQVQLYLSRRVKPALSFLTEVELYAAVARKVRSQEMEMADANRIFAKFQSHLDAESPVLQFKPFCSCDGDARDQITPQA
jgi:predicted nucleic acid-binding protein